MRSIMINGLLLFLLVGCANSEEQDLAAAETFSKDMSEIETSVDEQWKRFGKLVKAYEAGELNDEEGYDAFDELRSNLIRLSYQAEDVSIDENTSKETKQNLEGIRVTYADAVYELAKMAGHYRNYILSGDESYLDKVVERKEAYKEHMNEMNTIIERL